MTTIELYLQLFEIHQQLRYLKQHNLSKQVEYRLEDLYAELDDGDRKELAIAMQNIGA